MKQFKKYLQDKQNYNKEIKIGYIQINMFYKIVKTLL